MHSNRKIWLISSVLWFVFWGPGSKMPRIFSCHLNVYALRIIAFSQLYINLPIRITVNVLGFCSVSVCVCRWKSPVKSIFSQNLRPLICFLLTTVFLYIMILYGICCIHSVGSRLGRFFSLSFLTFYSDIHSFFRQNTQFSLDIFICFHSLNL